jgi:hypothetical protein
VADHPREQDEFALASQNKAEAAQKAGKFKDEIAPVTISTRKGDIVVDQDEYIRHGATLDSMTKLRPAFSKEGSVTAGNASGINDGAAAVVLMSAEEAKKRGIKPLARIGLGHRRRRSGDHGHGPDPGQPQGAGEGRLEGRRSRSRRGQRGLRRAGHRRQQGSGWDTSKVNVNGGAIAIGHPIGASGARVLVTRCCTKWPAATPRRASPRCASAAAWASPCASSADPARGRPLKQETAAREAPPFSTHLRSNGRIDRPEASTFSPYFHGRNISWHGLQL